MTDRKTDTSRQKLELGTPEAQHVCYTELNKVALVLCQAGSRRQVKLLLVGAVSVGRQSQGHDYLRGWGRRKLCGHLPHRLSASAHGPQKAFPASDLTSRGRLPFPHSSEAVVLDMAGSYQQHTSAQDFIHSELNS